METETDFQTVFQNLVNQYRLSPQTAAMLLERILAALQAVDQGNFETAG